MLLIKANVQQSSIHGLGLFAEEFIPKGTRIWQFSLGLDAEIDPAHFEKLSQRGKDFIFFYGFHSKKSGNYHFMLVFDSLADEIKSIPISPSIAADEVAKQFLAKLDEGGYSRDEDPINHFGAYFLLYNPATKQVFITHHKKSGLWLFPGGHVDRGETTIQTLKREMNEELGVIYNPSADQKPFLLTITRMDTVNYKCKTHFDVWYSVPMDGSDFKIDPSEFHDTKWVSIDEARKLMTDEQNLQALNKIEKILSA